MRSRPLPPDVLRELEELDRAVAGDPAAEPELLQLVADVRAAAPQADPAWAARLDGRVAEGFAPAPSAAPSVADRPARRRGLTWRLAPAGALLAGLVALVVVLGGSDDGERPTSAVSQSSTAAAPEAARDAAGAASADGGDGGAEPSATLEAVPPPTVQSDVAPSSTGRAYAPVPPVAPAPSRPGGSRSVERSAELELRVARKDVQRTGDGVVRTTQALGGYVQDSDVAVTDRGGTATYTLRVPSRRLQDALRRLSALGNVAALRQASEDITGQRDSAAGQLNDARAERRALLRALGRADSAREIAALRARIADNRRSIAQREAALTRVDRRAQLATVSVTVRAARADAAGDEDEGGAWTPGDALRDAWSVLQVIAGALVVGLAALLPVAALAALARLGLRRRREAVLEG
ncbi:DUF4349 domain-containing protein [Conexibacter sp. SYSU D00693]|uniref:DUF4349 domain-containing protein n=1 Tax=Conexibacter sp. SYSU D00693 TaxID=2812560 RepID=UPI00196A3692|nr:DUF4349 domain-containing protein [Conexibacter sp. SYSU D00693]